MRKVEITIDGRTIRAEKGEKLLWTALENGIYIPNLCAIREARTPQASCRLCFVEIEGYPHPVTACTEPVKEKMVVFTRSPRVDRLVKRAFALILSAHRLDCAHCPQNRACALQKIAQERGLKLTSGQPGNYVQKLPVDDSSPVFTYDPGKCVLCGRCVWACRERAGVAVLGFAYRGIERRVTTFLNLPLAKTKCTHCGECVKICPVGALSWKKT